MDIARCLVSLEGAKEDKASWSGFLRHLKKRGRGGIKLVISDACLGWLNRSMNFIRLPSGSGVSYIFTETYSLWFLVAKSNISPWCSRPSTPLRIARQLKKKQPLSSKSWRFKSLIKPPRRSKTVLERPWATMTFPVLTGAASAPIIRWNVSCVRSGVERALLVPSRMVTRP